MLFGVEEGASGGGPTYRPQSASPFGGVPAPSSRSFLDGSTLTATPHSFGNLRVVTPTGPVPLQPLQRQPHSGCFDYNSGAWGGIEVPPSPGGQSVLSTAGSTGTVTLSLAQVRFLQARI